MSWVLLPASRFPMPTVCQPSYNSLLVCHKALSLARYFFYCTLLSFSTSSRRPDWSVTLTLTTRNCTSVFQLRQCQQPCNSSWCAWRPSMRGWEVTGLRWTLTRLSWYGLVRNNSLASFHSPSYLCCPPRWPSRPRFTTSASFSTASWPRKTTFRHCVGPASGSYVNSDLSGRRWRLTLQSTCFHQQPSCCMVSVTVCWRNYKPFRMQLLRS